MIVRIHACSSGGLMLKKAGRGPEDPRLLHAPRPVPRASPGRRLRVSNGCPASLREPAQRVTISLATPLECRHDRLEIGIIRGKRDAGRSLRHREVVALPGAEG